MQSDLAAATSAAEQRLASLEESCHAKIEALQAAHAEQLSTQEVSVLRPCNAHFVVRSGGSLLQVGVQEAGRENLRRAEQKLHALSKSALQADRDEAGAAAKVRHAQKLSEKLSTELSRVRDEHAAQLEEHHSLKDAHAQSERERQRWEQQARASMQASGSALQGMDEALRKLSGTVSAQKAEIAALQATVQQQCRERVTLQSRLHAVPYERTRVNAA